jgi:hypothetical protein
VQAGSESTKLAKTKIAKRKTKVQNFKLENNVEGRVWKEEDRMQ